MNEKYLLQTFDLLINGSLLLDMYRSFLPWTNEDRLIFLEDHPELSGIEKDELLIPNIEEKYDEATGIKTTAWYNPEAEKTEEFTSTFDDEVIKWIDGQKKPIIDELETIMLSCSTKDSLAIKFGFL